MPDLPVPLALKACAVTLARRALVRSVPPAQLAGAVPLGRKAYAETRVLKGRRSRALPAPLAEVVPQDRKARPEIPVPKALQRLVALVQPDLPVMQARKDQPEKRAHTAPPAWLTAGLRTEPFGLNPTQRNFVVPTWIRCLRSRTTCSRTRP